jgi:hypothetical protein
MKVNLSRIEETVLAFKSTTITQQQFIKKIPKPFIRQNQTIIPKRFVGSIKDKIVAHTKNHINYAKALVYKVQQVKEVLPHMKPHDINEIKADYQEQRSVFSIL